MGTLIRFIDIFNSDNTFCSLVIFCFFQIEMSRENYQITSWLDYWNLFNELIELLKSDNKTEIIVDFKNAQKYVNGLTDGWYEFKFSFEKSINANRQNMTEQQNEIAAFLLTTINKTLTNR